MGNPPKSETDGVQVTLQNRPRPNKKLSKIVLHHGLASTVLAVRHQILPIQNTCSKATSVL